MKKTQKPTKAFSKGSRWRSAFGKALKYGIAVGAAALGARLGAQYIGDHIQDLQHLTQRVSEIPQYLQGLIPDGAQQLISDTIRATPRQIMDQGTNAIRAVRIALDQPVGTLVENALTLAERLIDHTGVPQPMHVENHFGPGQVLPLQQPPINVNTQAMLDALGEISDNRKRKKSTNFSSGKSKKSKG